MDSPDACTYAEIRTRIPDTIAWDYHFEPTGNIPVTFTVRSAVLKEAIDDLEWPGSSVQIRIQPDPPSVTFRAEGHGDLQVYANYPNCTFPTHICASFTSSGFWQIDFEYYSNNDLLVAFQCDQILSYRYKYKFLRATTSNLPSSVLKENRGSKVSIGRGGMVKIQHLVSVRAVGQYGFNEQPSRIAYLEFFVKPEEEDETPINDS